MMDDADGQQQQQMQAQQQLPSAQAYSQMVQPDPRGVEWTSAPRLDDRLGALQHEGQQARPAFLGLA